MFRRAGAETVGDAMQFHTMVTVEEHVGALSENLKNVSPVVDVQDNGVRGY
jgi:ribosomal protein S7